MATKLKNLSAYQPAEVPEATKMSFGIVVAEWNDHITFALLEGCKSALIKHGAKEENIHVAQVPGSFELPLGARILESKHHPDALICLGCVIKGETSHNEYINTAVANALMQMSISIGKPFIFGVLTPNDEQQAIDRAGGIHGNKGVEAAITAIRMVGLKQEVSLKGKKTIGF